MENHLTSYQSVITEIKCIISSGQEAAYSASSKAMLLTYWNIGKRIVEQEMGGSERAEYGKGLISQGLIPRSLLRKKLFCKVKR